MKAMVDNRICRREITWTLTRVPSDLTDMEVKIFVEPQLMAGYGTDRAEEVWVNNRLAVAVFNRGIKESDELRKRRRLKKALEKRNPDIAWGNRKAQFSSLGAWNNGVKAEVDTMSTALDLIRKRIAWDGRRLTAELWKIGSKTDLAITTGQGQQPTHGSGHPTGQMGHFQYTQQQGQCYRA